VSFDLIEWKLCFVSMNVVMGQKTIVKIPTTWGQLSVVVWPTFPSRGLHTARCCGNHFLPSNSYLNQWRSYSWCMWPRVHITNVSICSMCISQVGVYMEQIRVKVHCGANLWQTQRNLMGMGKCGWIDDPRWFPTTPKYCLLGLEAQEGHLFLELDTFHSIMGLCSS
jgi:hypothetical protein